MATIFARINWRWLMYHHNRVCRLVADWAGWNLFCTEFYEDSESGLHFDLWGRTSEHKSKSQIGFQTPKLFFMAVLKSYICMFLTKCNVFGSQNKSKLLTKNSTLYLYVWSTNFITFIRCWQAKSKNKMKEFLTIRHSVDLLWFRQPIENSPISIFGDKNYWGNWNFSCFC